MLVRVVPDIVLHQTLAVFAVPVDGLHVDAARTETNKTYTIFSRPGGQLTPRSQIVNTYPNSAPNGRAARLEVIGKRLLVACNAPGFLVRRCR